MEIDIVHEVTVFLGAIMKRHNDKGSYEVQQESLSDPKLVEIIKDACTRFQGNCAVLESAIGALCWGRVVGWHGVRVMHSSRTMRAYEKILGVKFREVLPPTTDHSERLAGIRMAKSLGKFWQVITAGMVPADEGRIAKAQ
jgi:hypothetical protein